MPQRPEGPPAHAPQSEPFETTGAFVMPTGPGYPPANDPFPPPPREDEAGPFETTGAFARPPEWNPPVDRPGGFFEGATDQSGAFGGQDGMAGGGRDPRDAGQTAAFGGQQGGTGAFGQPLDQPFDQPFDQSGPFDRPGPGHFEGADPYSSYDEDPANRTARFDAPSGPNPVYSEPPEPGDVKVAGEPTAVHTPAWAEAETGFLGSGWSNDSDGPEEPRGRRGGRRKSGRGGGGDDDDLLAAPGGAGKGKVAILSVAAVAVVLGGTVAGVKFMSSSGGASPKCEGMTCAAAQITTQSAPAASDPVEEEETEPEEEPTEDVADEEPSDTPKPTATYSAGTPRRTVTPTPTPTKTRVKKKAEPTEEPPVEDPPADELATDEPVETDDTPVTLDETESATGAGTEPLQNDSPAPIKTRQDPFGSSVPNDSSVNVQQSIQQRPASYKAEMTVSNDSVQTLQNPTVSLPVTGRVTKVAGADWTQDGDLLILALSTPLAVGDSINVSFTATGTGSKAQNCGMVEGECAVA